MSSLPTNLVVSPLSVQAQLVDKNGYLTPYGQRAWQDLIKAVNSALNILGQFNGVLGPQASVDGHTGTVSNIVSRLNAAGQLLSLTDVAADVNLDHIADTTAYQKTTSDQVAGAQVAFASLVASGPAANKALLYNGITWHPSDVPYSSISGAPLAPNDTPATASEFFSAYSAATGNFAKLQPAFSDLSGVATATQIPALSSLTGQITAGQLPAGGLTHVVPLGPLTVGGTAGSITFVDGQARSAVDPT